MARDIFKCGETNLLVYIIVILFGVGSWVAINGLWVELPVMVPHLNEGWTLPSYLSVIIQLANIGPLIVTLCNVFAPGKLKEKPVVYVITVIGAAACFLLAFFWKTSTYIAGAQRSTALLVLQFMLALVDCTSSVVFLPFMAIFKPQYMTAYFIGEGMSGLIPSVVALGQGVGQMTCQNVSSYNSTSNVTSFSIQPIFEKPKISVEDFFFFLFAMMLVSGLAFTLLNYLPYCKMEHARNKEYEESDTTTSSQMSSSYEMRREAPGAAGRFSDPADAGSSSDKLIKQGPKKQKLKINTEDVSFEKTPKGQAIIPKSKYLYFLVLTAGINGISNGVLPSVQTYSCLPYGNEVYHLAVTLANIANPVACFIAFFVPVTSSLVISLLTVLGLGTSGFLLLTAATSPTPVLVGTTAGNIIVVAAWVIAFLLLVFTKVSIATLFRQEGRKALFWVGAMTQLGSLIGAIIMYCLVNIANMFKMAPYCPS
ncbi:hypothetical protein FSP39_008119 [Pinctada imbricata]|uniref:Riboflavin transporter n=1 Tax=Pinctada imbricata TaxID=66713 RepID=A0AA88XID4_PINIB|nr:hypothetical protein FSP39_008119 [Pinctada imbricata]